MRYKRFCGLGNASNIPDRTSVWTFENRIGKSGVQALPDGISAQLLLPEREPGSSIHSPSWRKWGQVDPQHR